MRLLTVLTLIYAAVLVLALAATLTLIAVYLWRIARALHDTLAALGQVRDRTAPLQQHLAPLGALAGAPLQEIADAADTLARVRDRLADTAQTTAAGTGGRGR